MPRRAAPLLGLLIVPAVVGCATTASSYPGDRPRAGGAVEVQIRNDSQEDVEVYVDRDGGRSRLGIVLRNGNEQYALEGTTLPLSGRVRFALNVLGSTRSFVTEPVQVEGGETILVQIAPDLQLTRVDVRR